MWWKSPLSPLTVGDTAGLVITIALLGSGLLSPVCASASVKRKETVCRSCDGPGTPVTGGSCCPSSNYVLIYIGNMEGFVLLEVQIMSCGGKLRQGYDK